MWNVRVIGKNGTIKVYPAQTRAQARALANLARGLTAPLPRNVRIAHPYEKQGVYK